MHIVDEPVSAASYNERVNIAQGHGEWHAVWGHAYIRRCFATAFFLWCVVNCTAIRACFNVFECGVSCACGMKSMTRPYIYESTRFHLLPSAHNQRASN